MKLSKAIVGCSTVALAGASAGKENPLGAVISLLDSLSAKITKEGEEEAKSFKAFVEWCDDAARNKKFEITTATTRKGKLEAAIDKAAGDIQSSTSKIEELAGSIAGDSADLKSASEIRAKEASDFAANEAELADVVDTLGRAIAIIEREMAKNPAAFAQVDTSSLKGLINSLSAVATAASFSTADKQKLLSMVQAQSNADEDDSFGPPAAAAYKSHSSNILDVLEDLKEKAEEQLGDLRKAESNAKHNYNMLKQSLDDQMKADNKEFAEEKSAKAGSEGAKATAEGDLSVTEKDLADAQAALATANQFCMSTAADHAATVKAREEELKVIAEARQLLTDNTDGAVGQTYSLVQLERSESSLHTRADLANAEVVTIVKKLAQEYHSKALSQLASRINAVLHYGASAGEDPFVKVKALISDLITKLEQEAGSEATEKAYCDEQIAKTEAKKDELQYDISKLTSKIDQASAKSASLKESVAETQEELANLAKTQAEMDKVRQESHADYVKAKAELEQGLEGVRKAVGILRDYYGGSASAASSMLQSSDAQQPDVPELHEKATGAGSSIIGILEVVESDFAKNLATEETEESDAETQYQKNTQANKISRTLKEQDVKYNTQEFKGLDKSIADLTGDRESTDSELSAVLEYYAKIKERCIAKPETYGERKRRREAEIKGLKEALTILEDEAALVQRSKKGGLRSHFLGMARA